MRSYVEDAFWRVAAALFWLVVLSVGVILALGFIEVNYYPTLSEEILSWF